MLRLGRYYRAHLGVKYCSISGWICRVHGLTLPMVGLYTPSLAHEPRVASESINTILEAAGGEGNYRESLMPNHKSAEKRMRQNEKRKQINRSNRTRVRTSIRKLRGALESGDAKELQTLLPATVSTIDKAVQKGVLHRNTAARYKSRLTASANQATAK